MQVPLHTRTCSVMQSHSAGDSQTADGISHADCISAAAAGPRAPTNALSLDGAQETAVLCDVDHKGCPLGEQ